MLETVATLAPLPDSAPDWPAEWAEVPGERFIVMSEGDEIGTEYAVVSVPAGTDDPRIRRDLAPLVCLDGNIYTRDGDLHADCPHACPGTRGLYPVELAGRESCRRCLVTVEPE
jgi:hypothetical protein